MNSSARQYLLYALIALSAFGGGAWLALSNLRDPPKPTANQSIFALKLQDIDGKYQEFKQWRGKVLVVNFWATWCAPCREEIPMFVEVQQEHGAKGLQFVGISIDQADKTREFSKTFKINYPSLIGVFETLEASRSAGNTKGLLPFTVIFDRKGNIIATELGGLKRAKLEALVSPLF